VYHKKPVEITSKVTKRPYLKIMEKIRMKLFERLREKLGEEHPDSGIHQALRDRQIEESIKKLMKEDRLRLLDDQRQPVYVDQIALAAEQSEQQLPAKEELTTTVNVTAGQVDYHKTGTTLDVHDFDMQMLEREVLDHMRKNQTKPSE